MRHRIIVLWTVPRSVSTSFERMMSARGDHAVFDEPFSRSYYFGPDRRSWRYTDSLPDSSRPRRCWRPSRRRRSNDPSS